MGSTKKRESRNKGRFLHCFAGFTDTWRPAIDLFLIFFFKSAKKENK